MTSLYPGGLDSYSTKVDGVDDVMAVDINDPQDAIEALEAQHQARSLRKIKNGSGATLAANKVGYFDVAGDFVTTTSASKLASPWAAVISGGANNTQIVVGQGRVVVELTANCSIGDFLISSTTAGRAGVVAVWEEAVLAVALTANTDGAGGTCEAMLFPEIGFWVGFGVVVDEVRARGSGINFNDGQMFLQDSDGFLGINTITPGQQVDAVADGESAMLRFTAYKAASASIAGFFQFRAARGTLASPTALLSNDRIGGITGIGHDGGGFDASYSVGILYEADQNWTGAAQGTRITFQNIGFGTTSRATQMTLKSSGRLGVGTINPGAQIHADQASTTATIPVLSVDQADLSEEFIIFISTIGAGNPIDTAAIGTYYGKVRVAVNGTFKHLALYNI